MKRAELLAWRPVADDQYLKFTRDHLKIAGGDRAAGLIYAAIEFRTFPGGPGDTEFLEIDMSDLLAAMGGWEMNAETARAGIRKNLQSGVLVEGPRNVRNGWRLRIDRARVKQIMEMGTEEASGHFAEIRELTPLPIPPRKASSRVQYAEIRELPQAVGFGAPRAEISGGTPQTVERNSANPYIGSKDSSNYTKKLASCQYAEIRELEPEPQPAKSALESKIRSAAGSVRLSGESISDHTVRTMAVEIAKVSKFLEEMEVEALARRCAGYAHSDRRIGWGIAVNDTKEACARRIRELGGERKVAGSETTDVSIEEQIHTLRDFLEWNPTHQQRDQLRGKLEQLERQLGPCAKGAS